MPSQSPVPLGSWETPFTVLTSRMALSMAFLSSAVNLRGSLTSVFFGVASLTVVVLQDLNLPFSLTETPTIWSRSNVSVPGNAYENFPVAESTVATTGSAESLSVMHPWSLQYRCFFLGLTLVTISTLMLSKGPSPASWPVMVLSTTVRSLSVAPIDLPSTCLMTRPGASTLSDFEPSL